jgi:hypothetical protein
MTKAYQIRISPKVNFPPETELFCILERLLPIHFIIGELREIEIDGAVFSNSIADTDVTHTVSSLSVPLLSCSANSARQFEAEVKFADDPNVPFPFRARKIRTKLAQDWTVISVKNNEKILASSEQGPIWSVSENDGVKQFRSALALPSISPEQNFNDVFNGECFLQMLVLLEFIREISSGTAFQNAPLRASFIIDDPNLHGPRYGFFDYREIVAQATQENFHVSFATIPMDAWYAHSATADLFREHTQRISLLIHGNNHAKEELGLNYSEEDRKALLWQAIDRIRRLEKKSNVSVSRVMVPPHGACSNNMLATLPKCGFESACISTGSLRFHNHDKSWIKTLGFYPSEIIEGCPVLPRWGLTGNVENTLLIAAYLGQPMILRGHHQDLKGGGGKFIEFAKFINNLGNVFWSNMTDLSRLNYQWRLKGTTAWIRPFGQKTIFKLPKEITEITIDSSVEIDDSTWQIVFGDGKSCDIFPDQAFPLAKAMNGDIFINRNTSQFPYGLEKTRPTPPSLILRRLLTEARDRLLLSD